MWLVAILLDGAGLRLKFILSLCFGIALKQKKKKFFF